MILNALRSVASGTSGLRDGRPQPCLGLGLGSEGRKPTLISQTPGGMNFGLKMDENRMPGKHTGRKNGRLGKHTASLHLQMTTMLHRNIKRVTW